MSSIRWTARGPANSERSKCWPFTTTFLQSRETAVTVVAESRSRAGSDPSMPCAHMAPGSCRKSRRSGSAEKRRDGSVAARATEQEDRKRRSRTRDKNSATRKLRAGHAIKGNQSIVPSNARTLACTSRLFATQTCHNTITTTVQCCLPSCLVMRESKKCPTVIRTRPRWIPPSSILAS